MLKQHCFIYRFIYLLIHFLCCCVFFQLNYLACKKLTDMNKTTSISVGLLSKRPYFNIIKYFQKIHTTSCQKEVVSSFSNRTSLLLMLLLPIIFLPASIINKPFRKCINRFLKINHPKMLKRRLNSFFFFRWTLRHLRIFFLCQIIVLPYIHSTFSFNL